MPRSIPQPHLTEVRLVWRALAVLAIPLAVLTVFEAMVSPPERVVSVLASGAIAAFVAAVSWFLGPKFSPRTSYRVGRVFLFVGTLTVAQSMYNWRGTSVLGAIPFQFVVLMLFSTVFFGRRESCETFALAASSSALVLYMDGATSRNAFIWSTILVELGVVSFVVTKTVERMRSLSFNDPLTGALNRRWWTTSLAFEVADHQRRNESLSVLVLDIDNFKLINDANGHDGGDRFLQEAVKVFQSHCRSTDQCARLGGDEFALLLTDCDDVAALNFGDRLLEALLRETGHSCSIGVATLTPTRIETPEQLFARADRYLYVAKARGRAHVVSDLNSERVPTDHVVAGRTVTNRPSKENETNSLTTASR